MKTPKRDRSRTGIDTKMTPMIDVIFQLQIFFLCTAGFARPESLLPTRLPDSGGQTAEVAAAPVDLEVVRITLQQQEQELTIQLNGRTMNDTGPLRTELGKLGQVSADLPVILDIGPNVELRFVVDTYDGCLAAGLTTISFAANK